MQVVIAAETTNGWSLGAAILTFAFPMILFIIVASTLYVLYTKPHLVPGHRYHMEGASSVSTAPVTPPPQVVGQQRTGGQQTGGGGRQSIGDQPPSSGRRDA